MRRIVLVVGVLTIGTLIFGGRWFLTARTNEARAAATVATCPADTKAVVVSTVIVMNREQRTVQYLVMDAVAHKIASSAFEIPLLKAGDVVCVKNAATRDDWPVDIVALKAPMAKQR
jgi:hypothetical protein